jgi:hypothetical protein
VSHLGSAPPPRIRLLARRLRRRSAPNVRILFGLWSARPQYLDERREGLDAVDGIATSLEQAVERIHESVIPLAKDGSKSRHPDTMATIGTGNGGLAAN